MNKTIDLAVLNPTQTQDDVVRACKLVYHKELASVCVKPHDITLAKMCSCGVIKISTVINFPHGNETTSIRAEAASRAITDGADELDIVMQISKFLDGLYSEVEADLKRIVRLSDPVPIKVIIETGYLTNNEILIASKIVQNAGAAWVKSCTGFGQRGVTPDDIAIMTSIKDIQVKASGGIYKKEQAQAYLDQGCTRLGVGLSSIGGLL